MEDRRDYRRVYDLTGRLSSQSSISRFRHPILRSLRAKAEGNALLLHELIDRTAGEAGARLNLDSAQNCDGGLDLFGHNSLLSEVEILVGVERRFIAMRLDEDEETGRSWPMGVLRNNEPSRYGFVLALCANKCPRDCSIEQTVADVRFS